MPTIGHIFFVRGLNIYIIICLKIPETEKKLIILFSGRFLEYFFYSVIFLTRTTPSQFLLLLINVSFMFLLIIRNLILSKLLQ